MNIFLITMKNLKQHLLTTVLTILSVAIGIALVVIVANVKDQVRSHFFYVASNFELVVGAKGSPLQLVLNSVYFMSVPTGNIEYEYFDSLKDDPMIQMMIPLAMGDHYKEALIVGTSQDFFGEQNPLIKGKPEFQAGKPFKKVMEAVIGSNIASKYNLKTGESIIAAHGVMEAAETEEHTHQPYTIVGILKATHTPVDRTIFVDIRSVWHIHAHHNEHSADDQHTQHHEKTVISSTPADNIHKEMNILDEDALIEELIQDTEAFKKHQMRSKYAPIEVDNPEEKQITSILVKLASPSYLLEIKRSINDNTNYQAAIPAYQIQKMLSMVGQVDRILLFLSYLVILVAVISVFVSSYNIMNNRLREIAIFRAIGATRNWIFKMIILETALICLIGWISGFILGHLALYASTAYIEKISGVYINPAMITHEEIILIPIVVTLGVLSGVLPAIKAYKSDVSKNLSPTQ